MLWGYVIAGVGMWVSVLVLDVVEAVQRELVRRRALRRLAR